MKILSLFTLEINKLKRSISIWGTLAVLILIGSVIFKWQLSSYLATSQIALEKGDRIFGFTQVVAKPFWGWMLLMMTLITPILSMTQINNEKNRRSFDFFTLHRIPAYQIVLAKWLALSAYLTLCLIAISILPISSGFITSLDWGLLLSGLLTVWLCTLFILSLSFLFCFSLTNAMLSLTSIYATILMIIFVPIVIPFTPVAQFLSNLSFINHAHALMNGRLYLGDVLFFVLFSLLLISFSIKSANHFFMRLDKV